jgi:hypothetical protein
MLSPITPNIPKRLAPEVPTFNSTPSIGPTTLHITEQEQKKSRTTCCMAKRNDADRSISPKFRQVKASVLHEILLSRRKRLFGTIQSVYLKSSTLLFAFIRKPLYKPHGSLTVLANRQAD